MLYIRGHAVSLWRPMVVAFPSIMSKTSANATTETQPVPPSPMRLLCAVGALLAERPQLDQHSLRWTSRDSIRDGSGHRAAVSDKLADNHSGGRSLNAPVAYTDS
jgi:hypothetical protein